MEEGEVKETNIIDEKPKKEKKEKRGRSLIVRIFDILIWIVLLGWMAICITDFVQVQREEKTVFCKKYTTEEYSDGNVESCTGLGYKVINYNRKCYKAVEYGPFWAKDRSIDYETCK